MTDGTIRISRWMRGRTEPMSPAIRSLLRALRRERSSAEARFWTRTARTGTPLVEAIPGDGTHYWVTYVWRGERTTRAVRIFCPQTGFGASGNLERVPGTRVWFLTFRTRGDAFGGYKFLPDPPEATPADPVAYLRQLRKAKLDPQNPVVFTRPKDPENPRDPRFGLSVSILELPRSPRHSELEKHVGVPQGTLTLHRVRSRILRNTRRVWVYTPAGSRRLRHRAPLVIFFDGYDATTTVPTPTILDNLIHSRQIPPTVAVFVDSLGATRSVELPGYEPFGRFLVEELMPWIRRAVRFSPAPSTTVLSGASYGGLAAFYWALRRPKVFQRVLSQTGSVGWSPKGIDEPVWLAREFMRRPRLPLTIYMDVGRYEGRSEAENDVGQLSANRHVRDVLRMKGYPLRYREFCGAHDVYCCRQTLVDGLRWTLKKAG